MLLVECVLKPPEQTESEVLPYLAMHYIVCIMQYAYMYIPRAKFKVHIMILRVV